MGNSGKHVGEQSLITNFFHDFTKLVILLLFQIFIYYHGFVCDLLMALSSIALHSYSCLYHCSPDGLFHEGLSSS